MRSENSDSEFMTIQPGFRQVAENRSAPNSEMSKRQQGGFQHISQRDDSTERRSIQMG